MADSELQDELITVEWLMVKHSINKEEAESLLAFSKSKTIRYKSCYGNGSIIYPLWCKSVKK